MEECVLPLSRSATEVLRLTSRTFYLSIVRLPPRIQEAVMSAYLSLRAIDEIEDHARLDKLTKTTLLNQISCELQGKAPLHSCSALLQFYRDELPEVTNRLDEWTRLAPESIAPCICEATASMARRMAYWVGSDWQVRTKRDLDRYTFSVAGAVGVLLSDLWAWYDGTPSRKGDAIGYGRGLQAVNIFRNRSEDLARGVDFFPAGWNEGDFESYARRNLLRGDAYVEGFPAGPAREFCRVPQALAYATLDALARGESKLSRVAVLELVGSADSPSVTEFSLALRCEAIKGAHSPKDTELTEQLILVNERDEAIGVEEKIAAHLNGTLHRAFSVFVFNAVGQLLLQKRTSTKYHSKGLWSNTCCGHPRPGESIEGASRRRLREEMGIDCEVQKVFEFIYHASLEDGLNEHEYDHVLVGRFDGTPTPNTDEVDDWKWVDLPMLRLDVRARPDKYTSWFTISLEKLSRSGPPT